MAGSNNAAEWDQDRTGGLVRARRQATAFLVGAVVIFIAIEALTNGEGRWGYLRAASEAAIVGGIADWFAVVALFRHPLGIPIPHTAVIPRGKDVFGQSLGEFIAFNFLDPEQLELRLRQAHPAQRVGDWLIAPENALATSRRMAAVITGVAEGLNDEEVQGTIRELIEERVNKVELAPLAGTLLQHTIAGKHHEALIDSTLRSMAQIIDQRSDDLRDRMHDASPWWVPEQVDDYVFERISEAFRRFLEEVLADPSHEARQRLSEYLLQLADRLHTDPDLLQRGETLKAELLQHPTFNAWTEDLWQDAKTAVAAAADEPESELRNRIQHWVIALGERLRNDVELQDRATDWIATVAIRAAKQSGPEIAGVIASTVERWDTEETSRRLELLLGQDLQYIRINGTVVGGLVGLVIHSLVTLFS